MLSIVTLGVFYYVRAQRVAPPKFINQSGVPGHAAPAYSAVAKMEHGDSGSITTPAKEWTRQDEDKWEEVK